MSLTDNDVAIRCALCANTPERSEDGSPPLGWTSDVIASGAPDGRAGSTHTRWVCGACTRRYVRSIEAKLDHEWW